MDKKQDDIPLEEQKTKNDCPDKEVKAYSESQVSWFFFAVSMLGLLLIILNLFIGVHLPLVFIGFSLFLGVPAIVFAFILITISDS